MNNALLEKFVNRLSDAYNKSENSNVTKLATITTNELNTLENVYESIYNARDVDQAAGHMLEMIGADVRQPRGQATDDVYRTMVKVKIQRNLSDGSIDNLIDFLAFILNTPAESVNIDELYEIGRPATLHIDVPLDKVSTTGLSIGQFGTLINLVIAGGVKAEVLFEGTFELASGNTAEIDEEKGLSDVDQEQGGTLGSMYDPATDYELPV